MLWDFHGGNSTGVITAGGNGVIVNSTQLNYPVTCYLDSSSNNLIIINIANNNIDHWTLGVNHWMLLAGDINGLSGSTSTLFQSPRDLTLDPMGNLYVADGDNHRKQFFVSGQSNATTIAGVTGISGINSTLLYSPWSIALDNQLNLYIADTTNHCIQKFQRY